MKNFKSYTPRKYEDCAYEKIEEGIYRTKNPYRSIPSDVYVTSLTFEQEPELGEGATPKDISQIPFEALLDKFNLFVTDFYDEMNEKSNSVCYQEFASSDLENIRRLLCIIGKRVYMKSDPNSREEDGIILEELVVE